MVEHVNIADADRHEPKHASTAVNKTVLKSKGDGTTEFGFVDYSEVTNKPGNQGYLSSLYAASSSASQQPNNLSTPMTVEFGAAQGSATTDVSLTSGGLLTFNSAGQYLVEFILRMGRTGTSGTSVLFARAKINGTQVNNSLSVTLNNAQIQPVTAVLAINATAGMTLSVELIRDNSGVNDGGLFATTPSTSGWNISPSASLLVSKFKGYV